MTTARELADSAHDLAKSIIEGDPTGKREIPPMAFLAVNDGDEKGHIIPMPWRNNTEKNIFIATLREYIEEQEATAYCLVAEAWSSVYEEDESTAVKPIKRPNREEVLSFTFQDRGHRTTVAKAKIIHHQDGRRTVGPLDIEPDGKPSGLMVNLFEPVMTKH